MDVIDDKDQPLSRWAAEYSICDSCHIVDCSRNRSRVGHPCRTCGKPGTGGSIYFPPSVFTLIDAMHQFNHSKPELPAPHWFDDQAAGLAIVVFYCTLAEVLLTHFLKECMSRLALPSNVARLLLNDHRFMKERVDKLFPAVTGCKWSAAIRSLQKDGNDFTATVAFSTNVSNRRNSLLHAGNKYAIPKDLPRKCTEHIFPLINLFVALHNEFNVAPAAGSGVVT